MIRSFIALPVVATSEIAKVSKWLKSQGDGIRVLPPEELHLTVCFVGETPWELTSSIGNAIEEAISGMTAISAQLGPIGAFPNLNQPRVIWADVTPKEPLAELHDRLTDRLENLGFRMEQRGYIPHVTLARVKRELPEDFSEQLLRHSPADLGTVQLDNVVLFESQPGRAGPDYRVLTEHYL